jgi:hypothetical protein
MAALGKHRVTGDAPEVSEMHKENPAKFAAWNYLLLCAVLVHRELELTRGNHRRAR